MKRALSIEEPPPPQAPPECTLCGDSGFVYEEWEELPRHAIEPQMRARDPRCPHPIWANKHFKGRHPLEIIQLLSLSTSG